jgi:transcriptional regulator with XRE-family HTH domain
MVSGVVASVEGVADDEQGSSGRDGVDDRVDGLVDGLVSCCVTERWVVDGHQVVVASFGWFDGDVGADPLDLHAGLPRGSFGSVEGNLRDVDGGDLPSALREPDRIGSLAATHVERRPGSELVDLGDEGGVGPSAPPLPVARVPPVPMLGAVADVRGEREGGLFVDEVGVDGGGDAAALGGGLQHLVGDVGDVARGVDAGDGRGAALVRLDDLARPSRSGNRRDAECPPQLRPGNKAGGDDHDVGVDLPAVGETHAADDVVVDHDCRHRTILDLYAAGDQAGPLVGVEANALVHDHRDPIGQLAEEQRLVGGQRTGGDDRDPLVPHLPAVAVRAMDDATTPLLGHARDVGKLVDQSRGRDHATTRDDAPAREGDAEPTAVGIRRDRRRGVVDDLGAVAADLRASDGQELRWRPAVVAEVGVHVGGGRVAGLARIDDEDRPAGPGQLQRGGEPGGSTAHDDDIELPGVHWVLLIHGPTLRGSCPASKGACEIRKMGQTGLMGTEDATPTAIDTLVRTRLRSLRRAQGWSLDVLGARSSLSPSTISRIETGKRAMSLDVLLPLARALQIDLESLLEGDVDDPDVVIRPVPTSRPGRTTWPLSRPTGSAVALKMRFEPTEQPSDPRVHPGHDWFYVLAGRIRLTLGERTIVVETGEAAEFSTMTPHAFDALDRPAEVIMIFDRDGQHAHLHTET